MAYMQNYDADHAGRTASESAPPVVHMAEHWGGVVRRRWKTAVAVWVMAMAASVAVLLLIPKQFESSAKFLVRTARQDLLVGPNDGSASVYRDSVSEETLNSELELLRSRDIAVKVVQDLKLDRKYLIEDRPPALALELAVRDLSQGLNTAAIRRTNLIQISYLDTDPQAAADIVRHVADSYLAAHLAVHSTPGSYELFHTQAENARTDLQSAEQELAELARSANLVNPDAQKQEALTAVTTADAQLKALRAELSEQASRARAASMRMLEVPERIPTSRRTVPNQYSVERLNTLVVEMQNRRTDLLGKFKPDDRLIADLDRQIADTKAALERATTQSSNEEETDVNPLWLELRGDQVKAQLQMAGLASKATHLQQQIAEYRNLAQEVAEAGPTYNTLVRKVEEARNKYELYAKKEEEARIAEALDRQQISNVVLAQAPYASPLPARPNLRRGLILGFGVATMLAFGTALLAEYVFGARVSIASVRRRRPAHTSIVADLTEQEVLP